MDRNIPNDQHVCGPWADCDAACMERSYREYEADEADRTEPQENPCDSGWCGDSACYRCNPWGYPR
jgi:hypothetical protein